MLLIRDSNLIPIQPKATLGLSWHFNFAKTLRLYEWWIEETKIKYSLTPACTQSHPILLSKECGFGGHSGSSTEAGVKSASQ